MTATALNTASIASAAQTGAGASANTGGAGAMAGFEALLGALFPQAEAVIAPAAGGLPAATTTSVVIDAEALAEGSDETAEPGSPAAIEPAPAAPNAGDAAIALAASLIAIQPNTVETPITAAKDTSATTAFGRDKAKGVPAFPALQNANPHARLAEKAGLTVDSPESSDADGAVDVAAPDIETPAAPVPDAKAAPQAPTAARAAAPPPAPTVAADPQLDTTPAPAPVEPRTETASADAPPATMPTGFAPRPEAAPAPTPAPRATKSERAKAAADEASASSDLKPLEAADKPVHAKAAQATAKPASASVDAAEAAPEEISAEPESFEPTLPAETRATTQSSAPAHTSHGARGTPETVANLAAQILKKLDGRSTRFDVELNPHGLGKVDVRIEIGAQGRITAGMVFDNPQAAADVKARAAELQQALEQAGFDISGGISFDVAQDRGQQQQNQAWQDQGDASRAFQGRAFRAALDTAGDAAEAANQGALRLRRGVNAGLDLRI